MVKKKKVAELKVIEKKKHTTMGLGTSRGEGTTFSCLYSTARSPGTKYSTVRGKAGALKGIRQKSKTASKQ